MAQDWSTMPLDLLVAISMKLETCEDFIYFSLVCRWWNCVASSIKNDWRAKPTPWLLLAENFNENPNCLRKIFNLTNNKCYELTLPETFRTRCWGSAYGWVTMIDRHLNVKLFNPISKAHISFPSLENLSILGGYDPKSRKTRDEYITWCLRCFVTKIVVLKASQSCRHDFVIVAFCLSRCAAIARPGDQSWTLIPNDKANFPMVDVLVMDDHVFALYHDGRLVYWNANEFFDLEFVKQVDYLPRQPCVLGEELDYAFNKVYLVQSGSELVMVIRYKEEVGDDTGEGYDYDIVYQTYGFAVFKLNPTNKLWEEIKELHGLALLLGCNSSISISSSKYLQENCIYFTDDENVFWDEPKEFGGHDMGVFDMKENVIRGFYKVDSGMDDHDGFILEDLRGLISNQTEGGEDSSLKLMGSGYVKQDALLAISVVRALIPFLVIELPWEDLQIGERIGIGNISYIIHYVGSCLGKVPMSGMTWSARCSREKLKTTITKGRKRQPVEKGAVEVINP